MIKSKKTNNQKLILNKNFHRSVLIHHIIEAKSAITYWIKNPFLLLSALIPVTFFMTLIFVSGITFEKLDHVLKEFKPNQLIIYIKPKTPETKIENLTNDISNFFSNIQSIEYTPAESVAKELSNYFSSSKPTLESNGNNRENENKALSKLARPEILPTYLTISLENNSPISRESIQQLLSKHKFVLSFQYDNKWIEKIQLWVKSLGWFILIMATTLITLIVSSFIQLIRSDFLATKENVEVLYLLGAFPFYVRAPYCWRMSWLILISYTISIILAKFIDSWFNALIFSDSSIIHSELMSSRIGIIDILVVGLFLGSISFGLSSIISNFLYKKLSHVIR